MTKPILWVAQAQRAVDAFPLAVQMEVSRAAVIIAEGGKPLNAKPLRGLDSGAFEIAIRHH